MDEPIGDGADRRGRWTDDCTWYEASMWWCVAPGSPALPPWVAGRDGAEADRPDHERVPLTENEERLLAAIEEGLADERPDATAPCRDGPRPRAAGEDPFSARTPVLGIAGAVLAVVTMLTPSGPAVAALGAVVLVASAGRLVRSRGRHRPRRGAHRSRL